VFERFTDRARRTVVLAQEEARMLNHNYIGTEHLLLALAQDEDGIAAEALRSMNASLDLARLQVVEIVGQGRERSTAHIPFTPRAKLVLELALREALGLGHEHIGPEHILLGLVAEGEGIAAQVLQKQDVTLDELRRRVVVALEGDSPEHLAARFDIPSAEVEAIVNALGLPPEEVLPALNLILKVADRFDIKRMDLVRFIQDRRRSGQ
jgi:ATP-dependent Clp protease ATP-binding subunit ClpC